ncbi:MAG: alpha/beta hydrolase [Motilibacteraceae bacterium]
MPLDPATQGLLTMLEQLGRPPLSQQTPQAAREGFRALTVGLRQPEQVVPVGAVEDLTIPGSPAADERSGPLRLRVYRPEGEPQDAPTVVFFHGGGFVIGDLDTHDNQCRWLCRDTRSVVVSVDYRLAPEAPWPAAVEDCVAATRWAAEHVSELGGDVARLAVAGDSAGGNLAAVVAQLCRDEGAPALAAQLLIYPATDFTDGEHHASRVENAEGYFLTADDMRWFSANYAGAVQDRTQSALSPLHGRLEDLPPAVVVTAEYDPLRDEGEAYATALRAAGVPVSSRRFDGLVHGFFDMALVSPAAGAAVTETCRAFAEVLGTAG